MATIEKIDIEGQVTDVHTIYRKVRPEEFIRIFLSDLSGLLRIENMAEHKVLVHLWKLSAIAEENGLGNKLILVKAMKEQISDATGYTLPTINNTIAALVRKELLVNEKRTVYYLNPKYFFKGYDKDRNTAMDNFELRIKYKISQEAEAKYETGKVTGIYSTPEAEADTNAA